MTETPLVLENRHTGERLALRRIVEPDGQQVLALRGSLPPHRSGPPLHVHHHQDEQGRVIAGTLSVELDGRRFHVPAGGSASLPRGAAHRWWNDGDETLEFEGTARPAGDLDRYLQAAFDILNAGPDGRPPLFYMAHLSWRHRRTQTVILLPKPLQAVVVPLVVLLGTVLGRYRGTDWPGAPARYADAPVAADAPGR